MKLPLIDYRQFRLSRLNTPQFRHLKLLLFWPIFSLVFCYLENYRPTVYYAPMRCALDHWIPFCKWFVIPYAFWFLFVGGMLLYTLLYNIPAFRRMMWFIILTYSFALVTYLLFPNCQHLRPTLLGGDLLTRFTAKLYAADTNTNVCPSIHVIGSFAVYFAARDIRRFRAKGWRLGFLTHQPVYRIPQAALRSGCAGGAGCLRRSLSPDLSGTCQSRFSDPRRRSWPKAVPGAVTPLAFPTLSLYNRGTEFFCRIAPFSNDTAQEEAAMPTINRADPQNALFVAESPLVIGRALDAGCTPVSFLMETKHVNGKGAEILARCPADIPVYAAELEVLTQLTGFHLTRGMLCAMRRPPLPTVEEICAKSRRIAVLENVMNPTNIGAIFRSAAALGMDAVLLTAAGSDPLYRRASRVSMGNVFLVPWTYLPEGVDWTETLRQYGFKTAAMALREDSIRLNDPQLAREPKLAVVMGTEGDGLASDTIAHCDYTVMIPMTHGVDSLNVAAASAVAFYQLGLMSCPE